MEFGILSLLPPVLAIVLSLITRSVIPSLFGGVWLGATMVNDWNPFMGLFASFKDFIIPSVGDEWSATIILYCAFFGGLIAVIQKTGGAYAVAEAIAKRVKTPRGAQISTWFFGLAMFFDDYFNALTVGNVMRPITDKMKVSREKLAYIVDSTSAPVCLLVPVSTWVVFVMGLIGAQFATAGIAGNEYTAYLQTIPYNFYAILALLLVVIVAFTKMDFGPMAAAERRARTTGKVMREGSQPPSSDEITDSSLPEGVKPKLRNIVIPIVVLIGLIPPLFLWTGGFPENDFVTAVGESDGSTSIMIAAFVAGMVGLALGMGQKMFKLKEAVEIYFTGIKGMTLVYIILTLAWSIGSVADAVGTAEYVIAFAEQSTLPQLIPVLIFVVGAVIAFTTGTSYGTFAILIPIAVPLAIALDIPLAPVIAAVLSGGIFGDHCSPISDTTILSSAGSSCDHVDHVNTQLPYAITGGISGIVAFITVGFTNSLLLSALAGIVSLFVLLFVFSKIWVPKGKGHNVPA